MNIAHHIERGQRAAPDRAALIFEGRAWSYADLYRSASLIAGGLRANGVGRGDRVVILLPNSPEWALAYLGTLSLGAIAVSVNSAFKPDEVEFIVNDCVARAVITTSELAESNRGIVVPALETWVMADGESTAHPCLQAFLAGDAAAVPAVDVEPHEPAAIVYTSGTTGFPKGAVLSHGNVVSNIQAKQRYLGITAADRLLLFLPLFHCFGQNAVFNAALHSGATVVLHRKFATAPVLESIASDGVTMLFGVPATFMILQEKATAADLQGVRYFFSAAAPLPEDVERRWRERYGKPIYQGYGLTETSPFASYNHLTRHKPGSLGTPIEDVEMKIVDIDTGEDLPAGQVGEIAIRGPNVMLGYWNRPVETAEVIRDGWFFTGDIGRMDEEGYFFLQDRLKDMINVGGLKVYPAEVENVLHRHQAVAEAAVFAAADPVLGESVRAHVVLSPGQQTTVEELAAFCREHLADYKVPSSMSFVESIPKSPTGKILKRVLREQAAALPALAPIATAERDARDWLIGWLAREVGVAPAGIDVSRSFFDHGVTSAAAVRLARELGDWLGQTVEATIAWKSTSVAGLAAELAGRTGDFAPATGSPSVTAGDDFSALTDEQLAALLRAELEDLREKSQ